MPTTDSHLTPAVSHNEIAHPETETHPDPHRPKPPQRVTAEEAAGPLLTVDDVARRLNVSRDWVWDHSSRKTPHLPVIRMGDGTLRYRSSAIEAFITERERLSHFRVARR